MILWKATISVVGDLSLNYRFVDLLNNFEVNEEKDRIERHERRI